MEERIAGASGLKAGPLVDPRANLRQKKRDWNPEPLETSGKSMLPAICMPTWRNFTRRAYQCGLYEAQDVLAETSNVDLIHLDIGWGAWFKDTSLRRPIYHDVSKRLVFVNPGLKKTELHKDYDIFIAVCSIYADLPNINAISHWRRRCKLSICWLDELWAATVPNYKYWHPALDQFDYVFIGGRDSVSALSKAIGRTCHWLPGGVDALRFSPFPDPVDRVVDVYSIGRRHEAIHLELLKEAERSRLFYMYDTIANVANNNVRDHQKHRSFYASIAKRSRHFMVAVAKMDEPDQIQGQVEVGYRYYEGAAAGAVMIGDVPACEAYRALFDWPEAVLPVKPDGSDVVGVIHTLADNPERAAAIGVRNAKEALLRHDWVYRWCEMFRIAGIEPTPGVMARKQRLKELADLAENWQG
jgi:hypothetical protein